MIKKYHFIYKSTNLENQRFYVGMHSTENLDDGYLGSGTRILHEIKKYGKHSFSREILMFASTRDELRHLEESLVTETLLSNPLCLNLKKGGQGGWDHLNGDSTWRQNADLKHKMSESAKERRARKDDAELARDKKAAASLKRNHQSRTIEQKEQTRLKKIETFAKHSEERKAEINARRSEAAKKRWALSRLLRP